MIDRRAFVCFLVAALAAEPPFARGQAATKRRIGVLSPGEIPSQEVEALFWEPMRELGWTEGRNVTLERRFVGERSDLLRPSAEELVRLKVDVIVTLGTEAAIAAKNATASIPIVMGAAGDPVGTGLVASLAHPGSNITGYSILAPDLAAKRAAILQDVMPAAKRIAMMVNRFSATVLKRFEEAYQPLGLQLIFIEATSAQDFLSAPAEAARQHAQALEIGIATPVSVMSSLMQAAIDHRLPTMVQEPDLLEAGGLIYFSTNVDEQFLRVAAIVDKVLRGAKPADIPIEQPTRFTLAINLRTAKALGITIPSSLRLRADRVVE